MVNKLLENLNPEQIKAVTHKNGPLLVIAGAGTGKTMVITRRVAWLIEQKIAKPEEILALTFTDKAASEMEERVDQLVPYGYTDTFIGTFHSFGDQLIRDNHLELGLTADFRVLSQAEQILFVKENLFKFRLKDLLPLGNPEKFIPALLKIISRAKDEEIMPEDYKKYLKSGAPLKKGDRGIDSNAEELEFARQEEVANFYETYQKLLQENNYLDFGDQIILLLKLFRKRPDLLKEYQEKFKYILVDEYQDTNYAQNELVKLLAKKHQNITVVGDDDQSIYKFRGAAISNIIQFEKSFPKAKKIVLTQNYRSTQEILNNAYNLIQHNNPDRLEVQSKINKKLTAYLKKKGELKHYSFEKDYEEADWVAEKILELKNKNKKLKFNDFAILTRANSHAEQFVLSLKQLGIPYVFSGEKGYYQKPEINLLVAFLKVISNPEDNIAFFNLVSSEIYNLPQLDLVIINQFANRKNYSLFEVFDQITKGSEPPKISDPAKEIITTIENDIEKYLEESKKDMIGQILYSFLEDKHYLKILADENREEEIQNIARFFDKIKAFELTAENRNSANEFVDYLESLVEIGEGEKEFEPDLNTDAINVLTVHSAKGLEFENVFMANLVKDRFPSRNRKEQIELPDEMIKEILPEGDAHLQEERRLFYVGMTRAKTNLYLTTAENFQNTKRPKKPSRFVIEALGKDTMDETEKIKLPQLERIKRFKKKEPKQKIKSVSKKALVLSHRQIDDYLTCPKKYWYVHTLRVPLLRNHAIVFGSVIHNTIQDFLRDKQKGHLMSSEELKKAYQNHWINEGYLTREHEDQRKKEGIEILEKFYQKEKATKETPLYIEKPFKFSVDGTLVRGRWDRVDETKEGIELSDYKTSQAKDEKTAKRKVSDSRQLRLYALSYQNIYNQIPKAVSLIFLGSDNKGTKEVTKRDLEKSEEEIKKAAGGIKKQAFKAKPEYQACNYCPFKNICEDKQEK
ncbi:ATP-dependent helicase [Patescibacteria group bacterium]